MNKEVKMFISTYKTPENFDDILLESDGKVLTGLCFKNSADAQKHTEKAEQKELDIFDKTKQWLDIYFSGKNPNFTPKFEVEYKSDFQKQVLEIVKNIKFSQTMSYGEIAEQIAKQNGKTKMSAQAVGGAVGSNPICLIIPCHRVVGKTGKIVGYGGGIKNKISLLKLEKTKGVKYE